MGKLKNKNRHYRSKLTLLFLFGLSLACVAGYLFYQSYPEKPQLFQYIIGLRLPTLVCMVLLL